jgi:tetratricopeptide (TPR) repeat protein
MVELSLCMIVKNEARYLPRFFAAHLPFVDEAIVVDTGSVDETHAIVRSHGVKLKKLKFSGNFAEARNYALSLARGRWVLVLDADELLTSADFTQLRRLLRVGPRQPIGLRRFNYLRNGWFTDFDLVRVFPNDGEFEHRGGIFEKVVSRGKSCADSVAVNVSIHHLGFLKPERGLNLKRLVYLDKVQRAGRAARSREQKAFLRYFESVVLADLGRVEPAIGILQELMRDADDAHQGSERATFSSSVLAFANIAIARGAAASAVRVLRAHDFDGDQGWAERRTLALARAYAAKGELARAADLFRGLMAQASGFLPHATLNLALVHVLSGENRLAREYLQLAVHGNPLLRHAFSPGRASLGHRNEIIDVGVQLGNVRRLMSEIRRSA